MNARLLPILITLPLLLNGCASFSLFGSSKVKPVTVETKAVERTPLNLKDPSPLKPQKIEWVVITPENSEEVWAKLKNQKKDLVLFGLTDDGYEDISINMMEIRNFIDKQRTIIIKYKEYYETPRKE